jgi:RHS repeat-associated protein
VWDTVFKGFEYILRTDVTQEYSDDDIKNMGDAGLTDADVHDVLYPAVQHDNEPLEPTGSGLVIPANESSASSNVTMRTDYELTYYVNDTNRTYTQSLMEYGKRDELKAAHVYGVERLGTMTNDGEHETYLYDGRGSVTGAVAKSEVTRSLRYDPYGQITEGADPHTVTYGFNAEEYNPVTGLQYLRARYYAPGTGTFITRDSVLGRLESINSQQRYAYAEGDPVNNIDPSGHMVYKDPYAQQMEDAGSLNELRNFMVGISLKYSASQNNSFFQDAYYNLEIIKDSQMSSYTQGAIDKALAMAQRYGCSTATVAAVKAGAIDTKGASTITGTGSTFNSALDKFKKDIQQTKQTVNEKIEQEIERILNDVYTDNYYNTWYYTSMGVSASQIPWFDLNSWNQIHNEVQRNINGRYGFAINVQCPAGYADVVQIDSDGNWDKVWEVKPASYDAYAWKQRAALAQLKRYVDSVPGAKVGGGEISGNTFVDTKTGKYLIQYWNRFNGLIIYTFRFKPRAQPQPYPVSNPAPAPAPAPGGAPAPTPVPGAPGKGNSGQQPRPAPQPTPAPKPSPAPRPAPAWNRSPDWVWQLGVVILAVVFVGGVIIIGVPTGLVATLNYILGGVAIKARSITDSIFNTTPPMV